MYQQNSLLIASKCQRQFAAVCSCIVLSWISDGLVLLFLVLLCCATRDGDLPLIVAIDLQPMAPIEGVIQVQGDITNARTAEVVRRTEKWCRFLLLQFAGCD